MTKKERDNVIIDIGKYDMNIANLFDHIDVRWCNSDIFSRNYTRQIKYYYFAGRGTRTESEHNLPIGHPVKVTFIPKFLIIPLFSHCKNMNDFWAIIEFFRPYLIFMDFEVKHY